MFDATGKFVDDQLASVDRWAEESGAALRQEVAGMASGFEKSIHTELVELARDQDVQQTLQSSINQVAETKQNVTRLVDTASADLEKAKQQVGEFYDTAVVTAKAGIDRAERELTGVKNNLIDKLSTAQKLVNRAVDGLVREVDNAVGKLAETGQEILDSAVGLQDSLSDAVGGGTDTLANTRGSATDFAADSLDRLTKLLG
jgi:F0F1-type ATP synthase membrane subunit b/b'